MTAQDIRDRVLLLDVSPELRELLLDLVELADGKR